AAAVASPTKGGSPQSLAEQRRNEAFRMRVDAANAEHDLPLPDHVSNGDETRYANRIGNFSKGLPHNDLGEVDQNAYVAFLNALQSSDPGDMEKIVMGASDSSRQLKLVNPMAGLAFDLEGCDSHAPSQPAPP